MFRCSIFMASMKSSESTDFQGLRKFFFPIYRREIPKLLPMFLMSFLTCFNYSLLRNLKDSLLITAKSSGAEVLPFIKLWGILPAAIIMTSLFTWCSNRYRRPQVFVFFISGFLLYFALFAFVLFPMREAFQPHALCDYLEGVLGSGAKGFVAMFRNWTLSMFYIISEMWATVALGILFWGFANEITKVSEARRFYGVLGLGSNLAAIAAGWLGMVFSFSEMQTYFPLGKTPTEQSLMMLVSVILFSGLLILGIYNWMIRAVLSEGNHLEGEKKEKKKKMGFSESIGLVSRNSYLRNIAFIVVSYGVVINLIEVIWKDQLRILYPNAMDYNYFMNMVTLIIGLISATTAIFMATLIRRFGWTKIALICPLILLFTGISFFSCMFLPAGVMGGVVAFTGAASPLALVAFFGAAQNCLSKAAKYSVFDATKEISLIPLESTLKLRGKAAIDGIGSRLGKSGGSLIQQALLLSMGSLAAIAPVVACLIFVVVIGWFYSVIAVGKEFDRMTEVAQTNEESAHMGSADEEAKAV
jgi:AAA family ATP:ADP antiporter